MDMFYATLIVCKAVTSDWDAKQECDLDHAVYAEQSPPIFDSEEECMDGVIERLYNYPIDGLDPDTQYDISIECEKTLGEPA
jgi:hypothetical protein